MLINQTAVVAEEYVGRLIVSENQVTLRSVRMKDEGSFTVLDHGGKVRVRNCLNVRGEEVSVLPSGFSALIHRSLSISRECPVILCLLVCPI